MDVSFCGKVEDTPRMSIAKLGPVRLFQDMVRLTNFLPARFAGTSRYPNRDLAAVSQREGGDLGAMAVVALLEKLEGEAGKR